MNYFMLWAGLRALQGFVWMNPPASLSPERLTNFPRVVAVELASVVAVVSILSLLGVCNAEELEEKDREDKERSLATVPDSPGSVSLREVKTEPDGPCRPLVSWCQTVKDVSKTDEKSSARPNGFKNRELEQMEKRNRDEGRVIQNVYDRWYGEYALPYHLAARLSSKLLSHIYTVS